MGVLRANELMNTTNIEKVRSIGKGTHFSMVPLDVEEIHRFYWGKKNSFSMRLSAGKLSPVNETLKIGTVLEYMRFTRLRVAGHVMR